MTVTDPLAALAGALTRPLSISDLPSGDRGFELIDGSLYVTPLGDYEHQSLILDLAVGLTAAAPPGLKVLAGVNVISGDRTLVEPDVAVTDPAHVSPEGLGILVSGLVFVVEVTPPSTRRRDLTVKLDLYREWGVPYLIVDRWTTPFTLVEVGEIPSFARAVIDRFPA